MTLDRATRIGDDTLALAGHAEGMMDGKPFSAAFGIDRARNRAPAARAD